MNNKIRHRLRKRFGQNFLQDEWVLQKIVRHIAPKTQDYLVEIGPGQGALTDKLISHCHHLTLIEIDRDLVSLLRERYRTFRSVSIHQADVLKFNFDNLDRSQQSLRIIGNLPYNISTPLLFKLFKHLDSITDMTFMLQKEVVMRMTADVGQRNYGRLSIMTQYYCDAQLLFLVPPEAFFPIPKVESAVVQLSPRQQPFLQANHIDQLENIVRVAFSYRRKTIANALKKMLTTTEFDSLSIDPYKRPQDLSLDEYVKIANLMSLQ